MFENIINIIQSYNTNNAVSRNDDIDDHFFHHASKSLIDFDYTGHLPVPVYSYPRPTLGYKFILHKLLSMGRFSTEVELTLHATLQDAFR